MPSENSPTSPIVSLPCCSRLPRSSSPSRSTGRSQNRWIAPSFRPGAIHRRHFPNSLTSMSGRRRCSARSRTNTSRFAKMAALSRAPSARLAGAKRVQDIGRKLELSERNARLLFKFLAVRRIASCVVWARCWKFCLTAFAPDERSLSVRAGLVHGRFAAAPASLVKFKTGLSARLIKA
jgi:hypothetical protein